MLRLINVLTGRFSRSATVTYPRTASLSFDEVIKASPELAVFFQDENWWNHVERYFLFVNSLKSLLAPCISGTLVSRSAVIEKNVTLKGKVVVCDNVRIRSGAYIVGPVIIGDGSLIGPNCFLNRNLVIGPGARITQGAELKNSLLKNNVYMYHFSYLGDSIVGNNVNIAAGVITAVQRFDKKAIEIHIGDARLPTSRSKYGAVIGDDVQLGVNSIVYPGRLIAPSTLVPPGSLVKNNII